ncbi:hypothetical protein LPJ53_002911 [Coemansia erecta]|uniref:WD40 repeat-like protein n=1 Tax=Coemansia erecta TaxID=147472 RepID=A0A9W8CT08_9FUNG|nr:hypothetical protein LPJ53_002911 [Coemansia erecta]
MLKTKVTIDYNNSHSVVTSLCQMGSSSSAGRRLVAIGHQNGLVSIIEPASAIDSSGSSSNDNNITDRQRMEVWNGSGITSICRVASGSFLYTALGKGASSGSFSIFRNRSAHRLCKHRLVGMSVFGACIPQLETETLTPLEVSVAHSGGASVVSVGTGGPVGVFAAKTGSDILCTTFIADSRSVFVGGGRDGHIRLFDSRIDSKRHNQHRGLFSSKNGCRHKTGVHGISSMHNGMQQFASACMDGQVNTWDVRMIRGNDVGVGSIEPAVRCLNRLSERSEIAAPCMLGFGVSNDVVAAASGDGLVRLWSASSGRLLRAAPLPAARGLCRALDLDYNPTIAASTLYLGQGANVVAYRSNI